MRVEAAEKRVFKVGVYFGFGVLAKDNNFEDCEKGWWFWVSLVY